MCFATISISSGGFLWTLFTNPSAIINNNIEESFSWVTFTRLPFCKFVLLSRFCLPSTVHENVNYDRLITSTCHVSSSHKEIITQPTWISISRNVDARDGHLCPPVQKDSNGRFQFSRCSQMHHTSFSSATNLWGTYSFEFKHLYHSPSVPCADAQMPSPLWCTKTKAIDCHTITWR